MWAGPASWTGPQCQCGRAWNLEPLTFLITVFGLVFCKGSPLGQRSVHQRPAASAHVWSRLLPPACFPGVASWPPAPLTPGTLLLPTPTQPPCCLQPLEGPGCRYKDWSRSAAHPMGSGAGAWWWLSCLRCVCQVARGHTSACQQVKPAAHS